MKTSNAMQSAILAIEAQARRSVAREIKCGARRYALAPSSLETIHPGLSLAAPRGLVTRIRFLISNEIATPRRNFGFGGYMPLLCLRSAMLYARYARLIERSHRRAA
jgi:hypothetical protein